MALLQKHFLTLNFSLIFSWWWILTFLDRKEDRRKREAALAESGVIQVALLGIFSYIRIYHLFSPSLHLFHNFTNRKMKRLWNNLIFHLKSFEFFCRDCSCMPQLHAVMKWSLTSNWCIKHTQCACFQRSGYMLHLTFHFNHFSHPDFFKLTITVGQNCLWWQNWKGSNLFRDSDTVSTGML